MKSELDTRVSSPIRHSPPFHSPPAERGGSKKGNSPPAERGGSKKGNSPPAERGGSKKGNSPPAERGGSKGGESIENSTIQHLSIHLTGTVQGVGFRPFVYNLAQQNGLAGTVQNNSQGVLIHLQGKEDQLQSFVQSICRLAPSAACIDTVDISSLPVVKYSDFRILSSERLRDAFTQFPPDLALCPECRRELRDPGNRRFAYPFINCINCGPRFTIIRDLPYDRPLTVMSSFTMCSDCSAEYINPADRRFHAQPVACSKCGPTLTFLEAGSDGWNPRGDSESVIILTTDALRDRKIVLLHGIGGFHLACDACDENLVLELRRRKHRDEKPFALMFPSLESLRESCEVSRMEQDLLTSTHAPIVLLRKRGSSPVAPAVAPENPFLGAMLPYSPLHLLILQEFGHPLVMTSANLAEEPIIYRVHDALNRMRDVADAALIHNREIHIFTDDSVARVVSGAPRLWRRSRGYVPEAVRIRDRFSKEILAFGPQLKNTFCLGKKDFAFLSQHIGDMDCEKALEAQHTALEHFLHLFDMHIELAACDLHPDYVTTRLAEEWCDACDVPLVRVQHHHAHLVACLAENGETASAIGLCLDGTGYGTDGTIWGGEVLVGDANGFERAGHLQQVPMLGGERAVKEPWRMALAWLKEAFSDRIFDLQIKFLNTLRSEVGEKAMETLLNYSLIANVFPITSSLGRLFDAVAAILFFGTRRQYEGQAAMQLEWIMSSKPETPYPFDILPTTLPPISQAVRGYEKVSKSSCPQKRVSVNNNILLDSHLHGNYHAACGGATQHENSAQNPPLNPPLLRSGGSPGRYFQGNEEKSHSRKTHSAGGELKGRAIVLSPIPMFHALTTDIESGVSPEIISRRFHEGIVESFARICEIIRETSGLSTVAFSGGCFQNTFLHTHLEERLTAQGFRILTHRQVPANDGGVALGQAVIANSVKG